MRAAHVRSDGGRRLGFAALAGLLLGLFGCEPGEVERPAPLFDRVPIDYPVGLWDRGIEGTTVIRVRVDPEGRVDSAMVHESSGHPAFDSAALHGTRELRFRPALKDGERIPVWAWVPVHFSKDSIP